MASRHHYDPRCSMSLRLLLLLLRHRRSSLPNHRHRCHWRPLLASRSMSFRCQSHQDQSPRRPLSSTPAGIIIVPLRFVFQQGISLLSTYLIYVLHKIILRPWRVAALLVGNNNRPTAVAVSPIVMSAPHRHRHLLLLVVVRRLRRHRHWR